MKMKRKVMLSGLLALSAATCISLGIAFQSGGAVNASAEGEIAVSSVNTLGYLEWAAVDGATSYTVSSEYGEFTVTDTKASVGDAIVKAAKAAVADNAEATEATVEFTVTANTGETGEYSYTFGSYIDYDYSAIDVSEGQINTSGALLGDSLTLDSNKRKGAAGLSYKNTLLTFGLTTSTKFSTSSTSAHFYLFGDDSKTETDANEYLTSSGSTYATWVIQNQNTKLQIMANGGKAQATSDNWTQAAEYTGLTAHAANTLYNYTIAVFDTYALDGTTKCGETVYIRRDIVKNSVATEQFEIAKFVDATTLETTYGITEDDYEEATVAGWRVPKSTGLTWTVQSGKLSEDEIVSSFYESKSLSLSLEGDIGVNWYVNSPVAALNADKAVAQITFKGETTEQSVTATQDGCKVSYSVLPKDIDEKITARVVIPGGPIGYSVTYSVRDYINLVEDTDKEYGVVTALSAYGAAITNYFDETAEQPAVVEKSADAFADYAATVEGEDENVTLYGVSLIAETKTTLRLYFQVAEGVEMPTVTVDGEAATAVQSGNFYYVDVEDIAAQDLEKTYEFAVGGYTVTCCALTYGSLLSENDDNKTWSLMNALLAYYEAAEDYFNSEVTA